MKTWPAFRFSLPMLLGVVLLAAVLGVLRVTLRAGQVPEPPSEADARVQVPQQPQPGLVPPPVSQRAFSPDEWAQEIRCQAQRERKDRLTLGGKTFNECRDRLLREIDPRLRLENLPPMAAFARHGLETETVGAILEVLAEYPYSFFGPPPLPDVADYAQPGHGIGFVSIQLPVPQNIEPTEAEMDEDRVFDEMQMIVKIGPAAVPVLRNWLKEDNRAACSFALFVLPVLGRAAQQALPEVIALTQSKNHLAAADAFYALGDLIKDPKQLPVLLAGLKHKEWEVRCDTLSAINNLGPDFAKAAAADILLALEDRDGRVVEEAIEAAALAELGARGVPAMIKIIQGDDGGSQRTAFAYLQELGPAAKEAVPALIGILKDWPGSEKKRQFTIDRVHRSQIPPPGETRVAPRPAPMAEKIPAPTPMKTMPVTPVPAAAPPPVVGPVPLPGADPNNTALAVPPPAAGTERPPTRKGRVLPEIIVDIGPMADAEPPPLPRQIGTLWIGNIRSTQRMKRGEWVAYWKSFDEFTAALQTLEAIGPAARAAVPALQKLLDDGGARHEQEIRQTLAKINKK